MKPITIILTEGYSDWEIAPLAGVGSAFYGADIRFASPTGGALKSVAGLPVAATEPFVAQDGGVVVICGGPAWEKEPSPGLSRQLQQTLAAGGVLAAICGGTIALARAGILNNVAHTSNAPDYLAKLAPEYRGASHYIDQPSAVRDGNVITAPAPAPATFAAEVLKAAGLDAKSAGQIPAMLSNEHRAGFNAPT